MNQELEELVRPRIEDSYLRILVVEEDPELRSLVVSTLAHFGFGCQEAIDAGDALRILREAAAGRDDSPLQPEGGTLTPIGGLYASLTCEFGMVICDVRIPDRDSLWFLDQVLTTYPDVSVIMLTSVDRSRLAVECLRRGAADYLVKPIDMDDLLISVHQGLERRRLVIENQLYQTKLERMVQDRTFELRHTLDKLRDSYNQTLTALAAALDAREQETANHSVRVSGGCTRLLRRLGIDDDEALQAIEAGAVLHDIGKIGIPDAILLKEGPLDVSERAVMKRHPQIGYDMLRGIRFLDPSLEIVLYHQERYDGTGYPHGLAGEHIPLAARAFAVVDAWDAMTNTRPYRQAMTAKLAAEELRSCAGAHFDPVVVEAFLDMKRSEGALI